MGARGPFLGYFEVWQISVYQNQPVTCLQGGVSGIIPWIWGEAQTGIFLIGDWDAKGLS